MVVELVIVNFFDSVLYELRKYLLQIVYFP